MDPYHSISLLSILLYATMRFTLRIPCSLHKQSYLFSIHITLISSRQSAPLSKDNHRMVPHGKQILERYGPNSPTFRLTNSFVTQLSSVFLEHLSVSDSQQKGKTDLLKLRYSITEFRKFRNSWELEGKKRAEDEDFQLSSLLELNLTSEPCP